jgi:uncharacterized protein
METIAKVTATEAALKLINHLKTQHGELMFHQSGGCCDGSSPMCFPAGELIIGDGDVLLGEIGGCPFYIAAQQYKYWQHTQLIIDVASGQEAAIFPWKGRTESVLLLVLACLLRLINFFLLQWLME